MNLVRVLRCCAFGGLGMLLFAGATLPQTDITTGSDGAKPAATSPSTNPSVQGSPQIPPAGAPDDQTTDACEVEQDCIDSYLWSLYERAPKIDTVGVPEETKVTVKRRGKTRTVNKTVTKLVDEDFAWKDPKAAERAGMAPMDYVIGGMDPGFRLTLYRALRVLDDAGFKPGIMCAFRDDYRQSIATGLKAQNDRSFHGGSFRGGYGHGQAADIVSVRGENRTERLASTSQMWDFIDAHEKKLGIGRPYLDRDPPHVGPLDGAEYTDHRLRLKIQHTESDVKKNRQLASHIERNNAKRTKATAPPRAQAKTRAPAI